MSNAKHTESEGSPVEQWLPVVPDEGTEPLPAARYLDQWQDIDQAASFEKLIYAHSNKLADAFRRLFRFDPEALPLVGAGLFGFGICIYFMLLEEPVFAVLALLVLVSGIGYCRAHFFNRPKSAVVWAIVLLILSGAFFGQWQVKSSQAPMLSREITTAMTAIPIAAEATETGQRIRFRVLSAERLKDAETPRFVRLTSRSSTPVVLGEPVSFVARLLPHRGPAYPGGYAFQFAHYFQQTGALGFIYGDYRMPDLDNLEAHQGKLRISGPQAFRLWRENVRQGLATRIRSAVPGTPGHILVALVIGQRAAIPEDANESLRASGLAHILAISGLHLTLIAGTVFFVLRFALGLHPSWPLRFPVKKYAAIAALLVATVYLVISGSSVATQRAFITLAVMLIALLFDRRALSLRNVAIAAILVLMFQPQAVFAPGFHMSFAAVAALVMAYRTYGSAKLWAERNQRSVYPVVGLKAVATRLLARRDFAPPQTGWMPWMCRKVFLFFLGICATSLIAGLATSIFAAWHFQRVAPSSLFTNLAAMPVVTLLVMPFALLGMLLMPLGLAPPMMAISAFGIDRVVEIARWGEGFGWSGATGLIHPLTYALLLAGFCSIILLQHWRKVVGIPIVGLALIVPVNMDRPDILISENGKLIAALQRSDHSDGAQYVFSGKTQAFTRELWLKAFQPDGLKAEGPFMACDATGCLSIMGEGRRKLTLSKTPEDFLESCAKSDVVVTQYETDKQCGSALLITPDILMASGSVALYLPDKPTSEAKWEPKDIRIVGSRDQRKRPWLMSSRPSE